MSVSAQEHAQLQQKVEEQAITIERLTASLKGVGELLTQRFAQDDLRVKQNAASIAQISKMFNDLTEKVGIAPNHEAMAKIAAEQIQMLFQNPVMLDSISHILLNNAANAIAHKARSSDARPPKAMLVKAWFPGVQRLRHMEDGSILLENQLAGSTSPDEGWEEDHEWKEIEHADHALLEMLQSFGAEAGQMLYLTDDISYGKHRENLHTQLKAAAERRDREQAIALSQEPVPGPANEAAPVEVAVERGEGLEEPAAFDSFPEPEDGKPVEEEAPAAADVLSQIAAL